MRPEGVDHGGPVGAVLTWEGAFLMAMATASACASAAHLLPLPDEEEPNGDPVE